MVFLFLFQFFNFCPNFRIRMVVRDDNERFYEIIEYLWIFRRICFFDLRDTFYEIEILYII